MKIKSILLLAFIFTMFFCFGQQNNNWHFGYRACINFSTGVPINVPGSLLYANEGSSSISDLSGNTLFYTDGIKVWNKNNVQMSNGFGLFGGEPTLNSSSQSCIIIKQPGNTTMYYIFTDLEHRI